jgi:hypothetical protein
MRVGRRFGYTIYENPKDMPGHYVVRGWDVEDGDLIMADEAITIPISEEGLSTLRKSLQENGLFCIGRSPEDDLVILETWL